MPEQRNEAAEDGGAVEEGLDPLCILDAVICVHFVGANLQRLLVDVLRRADLVLLVPQEVCDEVSRKDRKYPGLQLRWRRLTQSRYIRVLPRIEAADAPDLVVHTFAAVRERQGEDVHRPSKDLGEAVVVAHGVYYQEQGHPVYVAIDDADGQAIANDHDLEVLPIEGVLEMAITFGHFQTEGELQKVYQKLRRFGDGLPSYDKTALAIRFKEWRSQRGS